MSRLRDNLRPSDPPPEDRPSDGPASDGPASDGPPSGSPAPPAESDSAPEPGPSAPKLALVVGVNLVLVLLLAELVALAAYAVETGALYYLSPPAGRSVVVDRDGGVEDFRLHPYFGFVNRPSGALNNNHGFVSRHDYPYRRRAADEFVVGVFGGSVAAELAVYEAEHRILASRLERRLGLPAGRVTVLNFAVGGYKAPQQWLTYGYFRALGQRLDLVVNIDGFNEIALAGRNAASGVAASMPSLDHLRALRDVTGQAGSLDSVERMLEIRAAWRAFARAFNRAWGGEAPELKVASGFLANFLVYKYHLRRYGRLLADYVEDTGAAMPNRPDGGGLDGPADGADDGVDDGPPSGEGAGDAWLTLVPADGGAGELDAAAAIGLWSESSRLLHRAVTADGGRYLHFVQPNQYFDTGRRFGPEERAVAFSDASPFAELIRRHYGDLVAAASALRADGVDSRSLTGLFDDVAEPIYDDDCCHYNDRGQRLLAAAVADAFERPSGGR